MWAPHVERLALVRERREVVLAVQVREVGVSLSSNTVRTLPMLTRAALTAVRSVAWRLINVALS